MISFIKGKLIEQEDTYIFLECNDIGYQIFVTEFFLQTLPPVGTTLKLHTYLHVKEDSLTLFGFSQRDELKVFQMLLAVSGVGPKGALAILSCLLPDDLRVAVSTQDAKAISKAQGIGSKTAQRIIIDLKDKLKLDDVNYVKSSSLSPSNSVIAGNIIISETIEALVSLGYSNQAASAAVRSLASEDCSDIEQCLKNALKIL